jgi:FkbM family methyltransferase
MSLKTIARRSVPRWVRNWVRSPLRSVHWIWNELQYQVGYRTNIELRPGWSILCHPASYRMAYSAQTRDPEQVAEFDGFVANCNFGMVLFDIGAHFGIFSLAALHFGGPNSRAVAVDPSPRALHMLKRQARMNNVLNRLTTIQAAVGSGTGNLAMVSTGVKGSDYFLAPIDHPESELIHVTELTIDELTGTTGLTPTHVKIDVEGFEAKVLRGGHCLFTKYAPVLFLELHTKIICERNSDPEESLHLLKGFGYRLFTSEGHPVCSHDLLEHPLVRCIARKS